MYYKNFKVPIHRANYIQLRNVYGGIRWELQCKSGKRYKYFRKPIRSANEIQSRKACDKVTRKVYNNSMENKTCAAARTKAGSLAGIVGIVLNFCLACAKITIGALFGLISVIADGFNNLSDCGSGAVTLVSFRIAAKPADKEHPYGHRRAEYVASMAIAFLVLVLAVELFRESIEKVVSGELSAGGFAVYTVLGISIAVKGGMFVYFRRQGKKLQSDALRAIAADSVCDCIATSAVLIGTVVSRYADLPADGWAGIFVALFIVWEGIAIFREAGSKLLGQAPDEKLIERIRELALSGEGVLGLHDLQVFAFGPETYYASVHIEMDAAVSVLLSHERIDAIERAVEEETGVLLTAHLDPVVTDDREAAALKARVIEAVCAVDASFGVHDFRLVRGERVSKAIFEVTIPYSCPKSEREAEREIVRVVRLLGVDPIVRVERA